MASPVSALPALPRQQHPDRAGRIHDREQFGANATQNCSRSWFAGMEARGRGARGYWRVTWCGIVRGMSIFDGPGDGRGTAGEHPARAGRGAVAVGLGGRGLDDRRRGAAPGPVRGGGRGDGRAQAAEHGAGRGGRRHHGRPGGAGGPGRTGGARGGVRAVAARPAGGADGAPGGRPGPAGAVGGRADEARHAGDHAAGRALGARPGHHRAARHRVSRHADGCGISPGWRTARCRTR